MEQAGFLFKYKASFESDESVMELNRTWRSETSENCDDCIFKCNTVLKAHKTVKNGQNMVDLIFVLGSHLEVIGAHS